MTSGPTTDRGARRTERVLQHLPGLRATVGATLVVVAAAGVLSARSSAGRPPSTQWAVVRADLPAGHVLRTDDLGVVALDLPAESRAVPADDARRLVGRRTTVALRRLDLIRPADVETGRAARATGIEVPVAVDAERSPGNLLRAGATVSVLATDLEAGGTTVVTPAAEVAAVAATDPALGEVGGAQVRLVVPDQAAATALVDAAVRAEITLTVPSPATPADGAPRP